MDLDDELVGNIHTGLVGWYDFKHNSRVLCMGKHREIIAAYLREQGLMPECQKGLVSMEPAWREEHKTGFDYIISICDLERERCPGELLAVWRSLLKQDGTLLLCMNNRFGLRYFCGDRDPYTGRNFDGIEGYQHVQGRMEHDFIGRMYSQTEMREMLNRSGWEKVQFYSVLPDLENCTLLYAEDTLPKEDLSNRLFPTYNYPDAVFLEERDIYSGLIENGMFHRMANAYLIECAPAGNFSDVQHVTGSMERDREHAFFTLIHRDGRVEKRAAYRDGQVHLRSMAENIAQLKGRGIPVVEGKLKGNRYVMPYMTGENGLLYLKRLLREDKEKFLQAMDHFLDLVKHSSEIERADVGDGNGAVLRHGYLDMVPWNCFYQDGEFIFFDQEFCEEHYPLNAILMRTVGPMQVQAKRIYGPSWPNDFLFQRYGLSQKRDHWQRMEGKFLEKVRKEKELHLYHQKCRYDLLTIHTNRQRINYPDEIYQRLFVDIFKGLEGKRLLLFGSGRYADQFLALYGKTYQVDIILDNNKSRWGGTLSGVPICSPDALRDMQAGTYRVIICIKDYLSVLHQLEELGVKETAVFDPNRDYPSHRHLQVVEKTDASKGEILPEKKYKVGYIAGVFDLFHIGHLNMFRRAKEQCEYLIVGVVTDEGVRKNKEVEPFIPFDERIEMVRSCRYVDEAVEIPENYGGTRDAWRMYHFDVQFSGSDYINDNYWLAEKEFLEKHGATLVFFPYTEQTSSTKIKTLINQKLAKNS